MLLMGSAMVSCGDDFLDSKQYNAVDLDTALNSVTNVGYALNGTYYNLFRYYFAGNYGTMIGDIASDISYWNGQNGHFNTLYQFSPTENDTYLYYIWDYGYKVVDNSARIIKAGKVLENELSGDELAELQMYMAEAYALRAYGSFYLANVFCHQIKVAGADFSSELGIVVVDEPIAAEQQVSRATLGETYNQIISDLNNSISYFDKSGYVQGGTYFSPEAAYGLLSRVQLYMENWDASISAAQNAIAISGIDTLTYDEASYKALYNGGGSNDESMFYLAIDATTNWSANSCGTLWSTYGYSPSPYLESIMGANDIRRCLWATSGTSTPAVPIMAYGGKFGCFSTGNPAAATNYLINAPEMFLNQAESYLNKNDLTNARENLLVVAKRNPDIASVDDLPATSAELKSFIQDERARELFQEGHRLWDLRRWNKTCNVYSTGAPEIAAFIENVQLGNVVFPIPVDEINTGYGVVQNPNWQSSLPK